MTKLSEFDQVLLERLAEKGEIDMQKKKRPGEREAGQAENCSALSSYLGKSSSI